MYVLLSRSSPFRICSNLNQISFSSIHCVDNLRHFMQRRNKTKNLRFSNIITEHIFSVNLLQRINTQRENDLINI